ncbi:MAG: flippase [Nitrospirae bacterium]|nr:flippase [Nitrospirota bacterium]
MIRNFLWFGFGSGAALVFTFLTQMYLARVLQPEGFGKLSYAMAWSNYLVLLADLGVSTYGMREIARDPARIRVHLERFLSLRWTCSLVLLVLFGAAVLLWPANGETKVLMVGFGLLLPARALSVDWALQGLERMPLTGLSRILASLVPLMLFFLWVRDPAGILRVPFLFVSGTVLANLAVLIGLGWMPGRWISSAGEIRNHAQRSLSFWSLTVMGNLYWGTADTIILNATRSQEELGHYAAAFRAMSVIQVVVAWLGSAIFPRLSNLGQSNSDAFLRQRKRFLWMSLGLGCALVALGWVLAGPAIGLVFGDAYASSIPLFRILLILVLLTGINGPFSQPLLALGYEKHVLGTVVVSAVAHVGLCLAIIPSRGGVGAAWITVASYAMGTALLVILYSVKVGRIHAHRRLP